MDNERSDTYLTMDELSSTALNSSDHNGNPSSPQEPPKQQQTWKEYKISAHTFLRYSWIPPLIISILLPGLCIFSYIAALYHSQIEPILPFVSDAGTSAPQAAYFSQALDILALFVFLTAIARFKQLRFYIQTKLRRDYIELHNQLAKYNRISLFVALLGGFLMIMVGNFRTTESNTVHSAAACSMLISMLFYASYVTYISYQLSKIANLESYPTTLGISIVVAIVAYICCIITSITSVGLFGIDNFNDNRARLNWSPGQPGYSWHVVSTTLEWVTINIFPLMYLCLCRRMYAFQDWAQV